MSSRLQDVIARGLAADKPLATAVAPGTLYYSTDTSTTERSNGTAWETYADVSAVSGDVVGPASAVDNQVALFDGVTGKLIKAGGNGTLASSLAIGTNPALLGALRLANNQAITARNAANTTDLQLLQSDIANNLVFGEGGGPGVYIDSGSIVVLRPGIGNYQYDGVAFYPGSDNDRNIGYGHLRFAKLFLGKELNIKETTAPAAPSANEANLWLQDDGGGNSQLMIQFSTGAAQVIAPAVASGAQIYKVNAIFDGGGVAPTAGSKVRVSIPVAGNIVRARILADVVGSAVVDVLKGTYAAYGTVASIAAAAKPTLSSVIKNEDTTLTGWTVAVAFGDVIVFNLDSAATLTWLNCELFIQP